MSSPSSNILKLEVPLKVGDQEGNGDVTLSARLLLPWEFHIHHFPATTQSNPAVFQGAEITNGCACCRPPSSPGPFPGV